MYLYILFRQWKYSAVMMLVAYAGAWRIIFDCHPRPTFIKAEDSYLLWVCVCLVINTHPRSFSNHDRYGAYVRWEYMQPGIHHGAPDKETG